ASHPWTGTLVLFQPAPVRADRMSLTDRSARSGLCCRSRCEVAPRCSLCGNAPLGDMISELAFYANQPKCALLAAARTHHIAIALIGRDLFGRVFQREVAR